MTSTALFIVHKTLPGKRDEVRDIWMKYMAQTIQENSGHLAYFYNFNNNDPDSICAFQQYESAEAAKAFLSHPNYQSYLEESRALLEHDPQIFSLSPQWIKSA